MAIKPLRLISCALVALFVTPVVYGFQPKIIPFSWEELENQYLVRHYTVEDGLPINTVSKMLHASDGFLYLVTLDGLVRFDGLHFRVFDSSNTPGFTSNRLLDMIEGKDGEIWLTDDLGNLYLFEQGKVRRLQDIKQFEGYEVREFAKTSNNEIWISTNKGVMYQEDGLDFLHISNEREHIPTNFMMITEKDGIFVVSDEGLILINKKESKIVIPINELKISGDRIFDIQSAGGASVWILSNIGSAVQISESFEQIEYTYEPGSVIDHYSVLRVNNEYILIKTDFGYVKPDFLSKKLEPVTLNGSEQLQTYTAQGKEVVPVIQKVDERVFVNGSEEFSAPSNIYAKLIDNEGNIWITTHGSGVYQLKRKKFITLGENLQDSLVNIYGMDDGKDGIWGASFIGKVFHLSNDQIRDYSLFEEGAQRKFFTVVTKTKVGEMYLGGFGIWKLNNDQWERFGGLSLVAESVTGFYEDSKDRFWVSTEKRLYQIKNEELVPFYDTNATMLAQVRSIQELQNGDLLFATVGSGIAVLGAGNEFRFLTESDGLSSNLVRDVYVASPDTFWVVTENNGFTRLILGDDYSVLKTDHVTTQDGLSDNSLHKLIEDEFGFFWINSNNKIMRVAKQNLNDYLHSKSSQLRVESFGINDGLLNNEGNGGRQNSGILTDDGKLLFPNQAGLVYTKPEWHIEESKIRLAPPRVETITFEDTVAVLENRPSFQLPKSVREAQIQFTLPTFQDPDELVLEYKVEGVNSDWQQVGQERTAVFTNLPKGKHVFLMRGKLLGSNEYSEASLSLLVPALFHETIWFYLLILCAIVTVLYLSIRVQLHQSKQREKTLNHLVNERTNELEEALREVKKLDESKSRFFTNFTHELRTPLSLILSPLEDILEGNGNKKNAYLNRHLGLMQRNAIRLKELVNRLLDVSKLSAGEFPLMLEPVALDTVTSLYASQFEHAFSKKELEFEIDQPEGLGLLYVDAKAWEHICTNLLSNAVKYTPNGGRVSIRFANKGETVSISFSDTGIGIPEKEQTKIFDPYYQVGSSVDQSGGTGIGLALVKGLVERMGGTISVQSKLSEGSVFTVNLKKGKEHFSTNDIIKDGVLSSSELEKASNGEVLNPNKEINVEPEITEVKPFFKNILLVEDNEDFRNYFYSLLADEYNVKTATNGFEGLELLTSFQPDIIISDIMMPEMDGYEMMRSIRNTKEYKSIPFIFLSAKDSVFDIETGLNSGADIYLTKPVENKLLLTQIKALLRREQVINEGRQNKALKGAVSTKVEEIIQRHLGNPDLSVEMIAEAMLMSRTTLFRKWKKENKTSLIQTITNKRLEESVNLIRKEGMIISEAAFAVGYKHLSHFSRAFKRVHGKSPQDFLKER